MILNTKKYGNIDVMATDSDYLRWVVEKSKYAIDIKEHCKIIIQQRMAGQLPEPPKPLELPKAPVVPQAAAYPPPAVPQGVPAPAPRVHEVGDQSQGTRARIVDLAIKLVGVDDKTVTIADAITKVSDYVLRNVNGFAPQMFAPPAGDPYLSELADDALPMNPPDQQHAFMPPEGTQ